MVKDNIELRAFNSIISALDPLDDDQRARVISSILTFLGIQESRAVSSSVTEARRPVSTHGSSFSEDRKSSPKQFLVEKQPQSDVERMACLAYYLTHYRETPHFKTIDLSKLNTEAAQPKFSNAAFTSRNAVHYGYLAPASKGQKQLSAAGEQFVMALPDRDAAKAAMAAARVRKRTAKVRKIKSIK